MQYVLTKFQIRPGTFDRFKALLDATHADRKAFEDGLIECGVSMECQFIERTAQGDFFYVFKRVTDNEVLKKQIKVSPSEVHELVREMHSYCLEGRQDLHSIITSDPAAAVK